MNKISHYLCTLILLCCSSAGWSAVGKYIEIEPDVEQLVIASTVDFRMTVNISDIYRDIVTPEPKDDGITINPARDFEGAKLWAQRAAFTAFIILLGVR